MSTGAGGEQQQGGSDGVPGAGEGEGLGEGVEGQERQWPLEGFYEPGAEAGEGNTQGAWWGLGVEKEDEFALAYQRYAGDLQFDPAPALEFTQVRSSTGSCFPPPSMCCCCCLCCYCVLGCCILFCVFCIPLCEVQAQSVTSSRAFCSSSASSFSCEISRLFACSRGWCGVCRSRPSLCLAPGCGRPWTFASCASKWYASCTLRTGDCCLCRECAACCCLYLESADCIQLFVS